MSAPCSKEAPAAEETAKLVRFVRLHLGDSNETVDKDEIDRSWVEAARILLQYQEPDRDYIESVLQKDETTLALLFFHLHFYLIRKSGK